MKKELLEIADLRRRLLVNGYEPLPNIDKRCMTKRWSKINIDEAAIARWSRKRRYLATGVRLGKGLAAIDLDISDETAMAAVSRAMEEKLREFGVDTANMPIRGTDVSCKQAWFVQTTSPFRQITTGSWVRPDQDEDAPKMVVEIFGGLSARQMGAFGPHSVDGSNQVQSRYTWPTGTSLLTVAKADLPVLTVQQFRDLINVANTQMEALGFVRASRRAPKQTTNSPGGTQRRVYDLTEDMRFDCNDGGTYTLAELRGICSWPRLRCSATWLDGIKHQNRERCLIRPDHRGGVSIYETAAGVTHHEASLKPGLWGPGNIDRLNDMLRQTQKKAAQHRKESRHDQ
ncbi:hypothetical protein ACLB6G_09445 [Zhengella sp. ZM62]|uniref:hypothetical protein n=1 Tax=Zhengella sedimenti TaxID=3390035 RepID=UPI0039763AFB